MTNPTPPPLPATEPQAETSGKMAADQPVNVEYIMELLPHRYPFLLIDRIKHIESHCIEAIKNVTANEPFFQGHFPGRPVMPGVLILEAMAQAGCLMLNNRIRRQRTLFLAGVDAARFKRPVVPGDVLEIRVRSVQERRRLGKAHAEAFVDGKLVCEADLMFANPEA